MGRPRAAAVAVAGAVAALVALTCLQGSCQALVTGPGRMMNELVNSSPRPVTPDLVRMKQALGIGLLGDMYLDVPAISGELMMPPWGSPTEDARPAFSHVHSLFEAGQKGPVLGQTGAWIRLRNATLVLSYHDGCPVQIYRVTSDGELHVEVMGSPLERADFRPTSILWPGDPLTLESLCADRGTLVSFVTIPAYNPGLRETLEPAKMAADFPQHAQLINRLASPEFDASHSPYFKMIANPADDIGNAGLTE